MSKRAPKENNMLDEVDENKAPDVGEFHARVDWLVPDSVASRYATNMVVQRNANEYSLNFFEVRLPLTVGTEQEQRAQLSGITSVQPICVGRIIVALDRLPEFLKVIESVILKPESAEKGSE